MEDARTSSAISRRGQHLLIASAFVAMAVAGYLLLLRPRILDWGATPGERRQPLPGDDLVPDATLQTTRAVTVNAPPTAIWPWLLQMGPRPRAGVYTYDWIERRLGIDVENAGRILPEHQHMEVGQFFPLDRHGTNGIVVRSVEPERALVLQWTPARSSWVFALCPSEDGHTTRVISRNRLPGSGMLFRLGMLAAMEPGSLVMERKMLLGIKERAEALARAAAAT